MHVYGAPTHWGADTSAGGRGASYGTPQTSNAIDCLVFRAIFCFLSRSRNLRIVAELIEPTSPMRVRSWKIYTWCSPWRRSLPLYSGSLILSGLLVTDCISAPPRCPRRRQALRKGVTSSSCRILG